MTTWRHRFTNENGNPYRHRPEPVEQMILGGGSIMLCAKCGTELRRYPSGRLPGAGA